MRNLECFQLILFDILQYSVVLLLQFFRDKFPTLFYVFNFKYFLYLQYFLVLFRICRFLNSLKSSRLQLINFHKFFPLDWITLYFFCCLATLKCSIKLQLLLFLDQLLHTNSQQLVNSVTSVNCIHCCCFAISR